MNSERSSLIQECIDQDVWAVVGYSADPSKYGHIIYNDLRRFGYRVYAVNPRGSVTGDVTVYRSLARLPEEPGVVDVVVPPKSGVGVLEECAAKNLRRVWLQPGAESGQLLELGRRLGLRVVHNACAMVEKRRRSKPFAKSQEPE